MKKNNLKEPQIWNLICEQIDKVRFKKTPNPWVNPTNENTEFPNNDAQPYQSQDTFNKTDDKKLVRKIKNQVRKKKTKENKTKKKEITMSQFLNDDALIKEFINDMITNSSNHRRKYK